MNERIKKLVLEAGFVHYGEDQGFYNIPVPAFNSRMEKFAELIVRECIQVAAKQRNPSNLNYKPSERFVEDLKLHFGVEE